MGSESRIVDRPASSVSGNHQSSFTSWMRLVLLVGCLAASRLEGQNLVVNGGFATGYDGWGLWGDPWDSRTWSSLDASGSPSSGSVKGVTQAGLGGCKFSFFQNFGGLAPNLQYDISFKTYIPENQAGVTGASAEIWVWWFDSNWVWLGEGTALGITQLGTWATASSQAVSVAGTANAQAALRLCQTSTSSLTAYWDDVTVWPSAAIPTSQRNTLIDLYNSTNGAGWTNKSGWLGPVGTECSWYGVTCDYWQTSVHSVHLDLNNLVGSIPSLSGLSSLRSLSVYGNQLTGSIPSLSGLGSLQTLNLSGNQLTGSIPSLSGLGSLQTLNLSGNQLSGSIPSLSGLSSLLELHLYDNQLTGSIPSLSGLSSLLDLYLYDNQLTGSIPSLSGLGSLQTLNLSGNQLTGSIPSLNGLSSLRSLNLSGNQLSGSIPSLSGLSSLLTLRLNNNLLTGSIPSLSGVGYLEDLFLQSNGLTGSLPSDIGDAAGLRELNVSGNNLLGPIATSITNLTSLTYTGLGYNGLYSTNSSVIAFLNSKDPDWQATQTVAPTGVSATPTSATSVTVSWTAIPYTGDSGYYRVYRATSFGGPYTSAGTTASKSATSLSVTGLSPSTTYYFVVETTTTPHGSNANTVTSEQTSPVSATTLAAAAATVSGGGTICRGSSVQIQAALTGSGPWNITWSDGVSQNGVSSSPATRTVSPSSTTVYTVTAISDTNGPGGSSGSATVTVGVPPATPTISGPDSVNPGQTGVTASVTSHGGATYAWGITSGTITAGQGTSTITFTAAAAGTVVLAVVETSAAGCASAQASKNIPIVSSVATVTVTGTTSICLGGSAQIRALLTGTPPWSLTWSDGLAQTGITESPVVRTVSPSVTTTYVVNAISDANGPGIDSGSAVITVNPVPSTPVITAPASATANQAGLAASVAARAGSSYTWTVTNGTLTAGQGTAAITFTAGDSGSVTLKVVEMSSAGCSSAEASRTVPIQAACAAPGALAFLSAPNAVVGGLTATFAWSGSSGLLSDGSYVLETSRNAFTTVETSISTKNTSAVLPTVVSGTDATLSVRVRAVQACGAATSSPAVNLIVRGTPASFVLTKGGPAWSAVVGDPAPSATVTYRNVGGVSGRLSLVPSASFFSVTPAAVDIDPGQEASVTLRASDAAMTFAGTYSGLLSAESGSTSVDTQVALTVVATPSPEDAVIGASTSSLAFVAAAGIDPSPQTLTIRASSRTSTAPIAFEVAISPGGSWLSVSGDLASPLPQGSERTLTFTVRRSKRSTDDGPPPLRTLVRITPVGADPATSSAVVEVVDTELTLVDVGGGRLLSPEPLAAPSSGTSFIVPTAVKATSGLNPGQVFVSDGWLRNLQSSPVATELYFTPDGKDGLTDPTVRRARTTLAAGQTFRLSDLVSTVFQTSATSGQVEVRSASPFALSLRTTAESIVSGDPRSRFGTEIPTVAFGSGVGRSGGELVVPGIDDDASNRSNLILAETSGSPATAKVTVYDADGLKVGELTRAVPAYGKVQVSGLVAQVAPGRSLSGGWAGVTVTEGNGKVVPVATVIDNRSGSFSAVLGKAVSAPAGAAREPMAGSLKYVIPSAVRTTGAFDTRFLTGVSLVNGTASAATLSLTYTYFDQDDGGRVKTATKPVILPPRGAISKAVGSDVIANLFGLTGRSYGYLTLEGDVAKVTGVASVSAQVDPQDASKGLKTAQVDGFMLTAPQVMGAREAERRFPGVEKSFQRRTNLILLEVGGEACEVTVRLNGPTGAKLAEKVFVVTAGQYLQINDVFGPGGLNLGEGPFQNVEVTAAVTSGSGKVVALATVNDNVSRNPQIFTLLPPGPANPTVGF